MKNEVPTITINDIAEMFIPDNLKDHFQLNEITQNRITLTEIKEPTIESKKFLEIFSFAVQMAGIEVSFE